MEETTSTQLDLSNDFKAGNVLVAEYQSAGRGRLDRKFVVPPRKGLTFSLCLSANKDFGWIPLLAGLASANAINKYLGEPQVEIKWPNDLLIGGKKLGGILSERTATGVVIGIGINIHQTPEELPILEAVSLTMLKQVDREALLVMMLNELGEVFSDFEASKNKYRSQCTTVGKSIAATLPNGEVIKDQALGISDDGSLLLRTREISVADIVHLRSDNE